MTIARATNVKQGIRRCSCSTTRALKNQLPTDLEKGVHDYEEICESHLCNTASAAFTLDTSVCSPAPSVMASSSKFVLGLAGFAAYFLM